MPKTFLLQLWQVSSAAENDVYMGGERHVIDYLFFKKIIFCSPCCRRNSEICKVQCKCMYSKLSKTILYYASVLLFPTKNIEPMDQHVSKAPSSCSSSITDFLSAHGSTVHQEHSLLQDQIRNCVVIQFGPIQ